MFIVGKNERPDVDNGIHKCHITYNNKFDDEKCNIDFVS
jgi:hypothetical protein